MTLNIWHNRCKEESVFKNGGDDSLVKGFSVKATCESASKILLLGDELSHHHSLIADLTANTQLKVETETEIDREVSPAELKQLDLIVLEVGESTSAAMNWLRRIKQMAPAIKIIVVNNGQSMELVARAFQYGAVDFFPKPLDVKLLTERIFHLVAAMSTTQVPGR